MVTSGADEGISVVQSNAVILYEAVGKVITMIQTVGESFDAILQWLPICLICECLSFWPFSFMET